MSILISDFDGTVTRYDFFDRVRMRWPFAPKDDPWEKFVAGEITHFQALAEIFARIRLQMSLPERSPFFSATKGVNKAAIVQDALGRSGRVAFVGDGRPDLRPALLVPPQLRFARGWLAETLNERGEKFHPFERWSEIADQLQKTEC